MRNLLRAALILLGLVFAAPVLAQSTVGPGQQILCPQQSMATVATATTTSMITGSAGKIIVMCGWHVTSTQSTSTTFQFVYGTQGGPCGSPVTLTPPFSVTSTAPSSDHIDYGSFSIPAGNQLCVITTGATVGQAILVYYSQF